MTAHRVLFFVSAAWLAGCRSTESGESASAHAPADPGASCHGDQDCSSSDCQRLEDPADTMHACGPAIIPAPPRCAPDASTCADDAMCAEADAGRVCLAVDRCTSTCMPGCTMDSDCPNAGTEQFERCMPNGRCAPQTCSANSGCPANYGCIGNVCTLGGCVDDADCHGVCVNGRCSSALGICRPAAPCPS